MIRRRFLKLIFFAIPLSFFSCDHSMVFHEFKHIDNSTWRWEDPVEFLTELKDTIQLHNILIQLRHTTDYPLSNLYLFVHVQGPSGQTLTDTINFILAEKSGKWLGNGLGNIREIGYLYRKNTIFPVQGFYKISIEQAMRLPEVPVTDIGLRIERVNN